MIATEKSLFVPNCVFIPANAVVQDRRGKHVDPDDATLLLLEGDNNFGEVFTKEAWQIDGPPSFIRRFGQFVMPDESSIEPVQGRVELLPDLCVVKIDERKWWLDPAILERTNRIFGVYVFDRRQHFHLCSFTASYELHFLGSQWEEIDGLTDEDHDDLWDRIVQGDGQSEPVSYWDKSDIDRMLETTCREGFLPNRSSCGGFPMTGIVSVTTDDAIEEARESYQASEF
ncbi:MAG: hypothetical protein ACKVP0_06795 [Pirellulaceae bacterium]